MERDTKSTTDDSSWTAVTVDSCQRVVGPFFHGTRVALQVGDELLAGRFSNFHPDRVVNHIYFAALVETAERGAELATALAESDQRGRVYVVEPTGPFQDDRNVTNTKSPGNPTWYYRSRYPLRIIRQVQDRQGDDCDRLGAMLTVVRNLRAQGHDLIDD